MKTRNLQPTTHTCTGVTLIELLVVILIVSFLWFLLAKRFGDHIEIAKRATCKSNIRIIQGQLEIYEARYGKYPASGQKEFEDFLNNKRFFVSKPTCPFNDEKSGVIFPYKIDPQTGIVLPHNHPEKIFVLEKSWLEKVTENIVNRIKLLLRISLSDTYSTQPIV